MVKGVWLRLYSMKMRMHYQQFPSGLMREAILVSHEGEPDHPYNFVLGGMLWGGSIRPEYWQKVLTILEGIEGESGASVETFGYNDWIAEVTSDKVKIELLIDDTCAGEFPIKHVKRAVEGWKRFMEMPEAPESEVIVDLDA